MQTLSLEDLMIHSVLEVRTGAAALLELGSEPLYILAQHLFLLRLRVLIEGLATMARCVITYALLIRGIGLVGLCSPFNVSLLLVLVSSQQRVVTAKFCVHTTVTDLISTPSLFRIFLLSIIKR